MVIWVQRAAAHPLLIMTELSASPPTFLRYQARALHPPHFSHFPHFLHFSGIKLELNTRVVSVADGAMTVLDLDGKSRLIPFGACVWATGFGANPLAEMLQKQLPEQDNARFVC